MMFTSLIKQQFWHTQTINFSETFGVKTLVTANLSIVDF